MDSLVIRQDESGVSFEVRVAPRASRAAILGVHGGALKVGLTAAPVDGAANEALVKLLAKALSVRPRAVTIARGHRARTKTVRVDGVDVDAVRTLVTVETHD